MWLEIKYHKGLVKDFKDFLINYIVLLFHMLIQNSEFLISRVIFGYNYLEN